MEWVIGIGAIVLVVGGVIFWPNVLKKIMPPPIVPPPKNTLSARVDSLHHHRDQVVAISADIRKDLDLVNADVGDAMAKLTKKPE